MSKKPTSNIALSMKELQFLAKAIRSLPKEEKDEQMITTLEVKFHDAGRLATIEELMLG